jgi:hypothetical protein
MLRNAFAVYFSDFRIINLCSFEAEKLDKDNWLRYDPSLLTPPHFAFIANVNLVRAISFRTFLLTLAKLRCPTLLLAAELLLQFFVSVRHACDRGQFSGAREFLY